MDQKLIEKAVEYLERADNFILSEAPEIISQTLKYQKSATFLELGALSIIIISATACFIYFWRNPSLGKYDSLTLATILGRTLPIFFAIPSLTGFIACIEKIMKISMAPKLFLLEFFLNLKG